MINCLIHAGDNNNKYHNRISS